LHHQPNPRPLWDAMTRALRPSGTLRLMIYAHHSRRLERRIQSRASPLWESVTNWQKTSFVEELWLRLRLKLRALALKTWCLQNLFPWAAGRFRYLGATGRYAPDALLHPSDPGLSLPDLRQLWESTGFELLYCEGKTFAHGAVIGIGPWEERLQGWQHLEEADRQGDLLSNVVCILKKKPCHKNRDCDVAL
jgi:hypothetical protein